MNRFELVTMIAKQHHEELLREAEQYRLLNEAYRIKTPKNGRFDQILAFIGKGLTSAGHSLEIRFSGQSEPRPAMNPQTNPGGCT